MEKTTTPEIQRANLATVALQILTLELHPNYFDFLDKPSKDAVGLACEQLKLLGAVNSVDSIILTPLGRKMSKFPLDPR